MALVYTTRNTISSARSCCNVIDSIPLGLIINTEALQPSYNIKPYWTRIQSLFWVQFHKYFERNIAWKKKKVNLTWCYPFKFFFLVSTTTTPKMMMVTSVAEMRIWAWPSFSVSFSPKTYFNICWACVYVSFFINNKFISHNNSGNHLRKYDVFPKGKRSKQMSL